MVVLTAFKAVKLAKLFEKYNLFCTNTSLVHVALESTTDWSVLDIVPVEILSPLPTFTPPRTVDDAVGKL